MNATSLEEGPWNGAKYVLTASAHNNLLCILHAFSSASVFLLGVFFFFFPKNLAFYHDSFTVRHRSNMLTLTNKA